MSQDFLIIFPYEFLATNYLYKFLKFINLQL